MAPAAGPPMHVPVDGIGWDINALPCERCDVDGKVVADPQGNGQVEDPRSPPLRKYDAPEIEALRAELALHNGIPGLEIFSPEDDPAEICRVYRRDGFVVVRDALHAEQLEFLRSGCSKVRRFLSLFSYFSHFSHVSLISLTLSRRRSR